MAAPIQKLAQLCSRIFGDLAMLSEKITHEHLAPLVCAINNIRATDLRFDPKDIQERDDNLTDLDQRVERAPVTYMHLLQENTHTMSVFIVKGGCSLPLHDHPCMHGLLKVIHGKIKIISYTEVKSEMLPEGSKNALLGLPFPSSCSSSRSRSKTHNMKTVIKHQDIILSSEDDCCILSPIEGNIHEIQSVTKMAAFLDILAPPYENDNCHYYKEIAADSTGEKRWLVEVPQPLTYWCDTIDYKGPNLQRSRPTS